MLGGRGPKHVLLAFSDVDVSARVAREFLTAGVMATLVPSREEVFIAIPDSRYRLLVIDAPLVDEGFLVAVSAVRPGTDLPIAMLGEVRGPSVDSVSELVDLVLPESITFEELVDRSLRLMAMTRPVREPALLCWGRFELDVRRRQAFWHGKPISLTTTQFRLMEIMVLAGGDVVTGEQLSRRLWGDSTFHDAERLLAHIRRIRKKIEDDPTHPRFLLTVRGEGFRLNEDVDLYDVQTP